MDVFNKNNISICQHRIHEELMNNITKLVCSTLGNTIAIDYEIRLESKSDINKHINGCINKLRYFLGQKVITDESFSTVLMLFSVAISPDTTTYQDKDNMISKSEDLVIDLLTNNHFSDINTAEKQIIRQVLKYMLAEKNSYELINFSQTEPEIFRTTVMHNIKKHQDLHTVSTNSVSEINTILNLATAYNKKTEIFKQATSKIITAICVLGVGAISVATAGATFAFLVVPASILAVEYAPKIGEKMGSVMLKADTSMKSQQEKIDTLKANLVKDNKEFLSKQHAIEHSTLTENLLDQRVKSSKVNIVQDIVAVNLHNNKQSLSKRKATELIKQR